MHSRGRGSLRRLRRISAPGTPRVGFLSQAISEGGGRGQPVTCTIVTSTYSEHCGSCLELKTRGIKTETAKQRMSVFTERKMNFVSLQVVLQ